MRKQVMVCGVDCHPGAEYCNGYCTGGADSAPERPDERGASLLGIADRPGKIGKAEIRTYFEAAVNNTPALRSKTPLGFITLNGKFSHYVAPDTDTMWLGFALGMRCAERVQAAKDKLQASESR